MLSTSKTIKNCKMMRNSDFTISFTTMINANNTKIQPNKNA